jgi:hypothetical protein
MAFAAPIVPAACAFAPDISVLLTFDAVCSPALPTPAAAFSPTPSSPDRRLY